MNNNLLYILHFLILKTLLFLASRACVLYCNKIYFVTMNKLNKVKIIEKYIYSFNYD